MMPLLAVKMEKDHEPRNSYSFLEDRKGKKMDSGASVKECSPSDALILA